MPTGTKSIRRDIWKHHFKYRDGVLVWAVSTSNRVVVGAPAGFRNSDYMYVRLNGIAYPVHKVVWEMHNGDTDSQIDHKDQDKLNNNISNLRLATRSQNEANTGLRKNNNSGYKGVYLFKRTNRWRAKINHNDVEIHLGYFDTAELAALAYNEAAIQLKGEFAILNEIY